MPLALRLRLNLLASSGIHDQAWLSRGTVLLTIWRCRSALAQLAAQMNQLPVNARIETVTRQGQIEADRRFTIRARNAAITSAVSTWNLSIGDVAQFAGLDDSDINTILDIARPPETPVPTHSSSPNRLHEHAAWHDLELGLRAYQRSEHWYVARDDSGSWHWAREVIDTQARLHAMELIAAVHRELVGDREASEIRAATSTFVVDTLDGANFGAGSLHGLAYEPDQRPSSRLLEFLYSGQHEEPDELETRRRWSQRFRTAYHTRLPSWMVQSGVPSSICIYQEPTPMHVGLMNIAALQEVANAAHKSLNASLSKQNSYVSDAEDLLKRHSQSHFAAMSGWRKKNVTRRAVARAVPGLRHWDEQQLALEANLKTARQVAQLNASVTDTPAYEASSRGRCELNRQILARVEVARHLGYVDHSFGRYPTSNNQVLWDLGAELMRLEAIDRADTDAVRALCRAAVEADLKQRQQMQSPYIRRTPSPTVGLRADA